MTYYNFGKDISRKFYPLLNDLPVLLPTQTPTIYIFSAHPTLNDARDGGGAVATISSWTQNTVTPYDCTYTIPAIDDPDPESLIPQRTYYIAINFILQSSEQIQTVLQSIDLERVSGTPENLTVTYTDLTEIYPAISSYATNAQLTEYIETAIKDAELELLGKGIRRSDIQNLDSLATAIKYGAIQVFCRSQIANGGSDKFITMYELYTTAYERAMKHVILYVDTNRDGVPDQSAKGKPGYVITSR